MKLFIELYRSSFLIFLTQEKVHMVGLNIYLDNIQVIDFRKFRNISKCLFENIFKSCTSKPLSIHSRVSISDAQHDVAKWTAGVLATALPFHLNPFKCNHF